MKKFLLLIALSTVFISCSSLFEGQLDRKTSLTINLPKNKLSNSRAIYDEDEIPDAHSLENYEIVVTINKYDENNPSKILDTKTEKCTDKSNKVKFQNITPGTWSVSCVLSTKGKPDFAFAMDTKILEAGKNNVVTLALSNNIISETNKIENIVLSKAPDKTSYELGDSIDSSGAMFSVKLTNGYEVELSENDLYELCIVNEMPQAEFMKAKKEFDGEKEILVFDNNNETSSIAERYFFYIGYKLNTPDGLFYPNTNQLLDDYEKQIRINAKTPVIETQPKNTLFKSNNYDFEFDIKIKPNEYYGDIIYLWSGENRRENGQRDWTKSNYVGQLRPEESSTSIYYSKEMFYCVVRNTDTNGGLNGDTQRTCRSRNVYLEYIVPNSTTEGQKYYDYSYKVVCDRSSFVSEITSSGQSFLTPEDFHIEITRFNQNDSSKALCVDDYAVENYNLTIEILSNYDGAYCFGYVPYRVRYTVPQHVGRVYDESTGSYNFVNVGPKEESNVFQIETFISKIPDSSYELYNVIDNNPFAVRYFDPDAQFLNDQWYYEENGEIKKNDLNIDLIDGTNVSKEYVYLPKPNFFDNQKYLYYPTTNNTLPDTKLNELFKPVGYKAYFYKNEKRRPYKTIDFDTASENNIAVFDLEDKNYISANEDSSISVKIEAITGIKQDYKNWFVDSSDRAFKSEGSIEFRMKK